MTERKDRYGNLITTEIGRFSLVGAKKSLKENTNGNLRSNSSLSGGTGEGQTQNKSQSADKNKRHKISFYDEVTSDKSKLT